MNKLQWRPQKSYADFFCTDAKEIIRNRSIFKEGIEYFVSYGGRGSAKTWTFSDACVVEGALRPIRILVTRELQTSIEESIKSEIEASIQKRGFSNFYHITERSIRGLNGTKFIFKGLKNNISSLMSISDVDIVLAEESQNISKNSWEKFLPSIRPKSGMDPIHIIIFNPDDELDDTYQRFIINPPPNTMAKITNWRDNKYFPDHLERQRQHALKTMPRVEYDNIWEGKVKSLGDHTIINREWVRAARFASRKKGFERVGPRVVGYDPAGQGRDENAVVFADGNIIRRIDEWLKSPDLRQATRRALQMAKDEEVEVFRYDECGGFGDGIAVFVNDVLEGKDENMESFSIDVIPFNAGDVVVNKDEIIEGTDKTNEEIYSNLKAQAHGISAQKLYSTYRFVILGEEVDSKDMVSIDIEDNDQFNKLVRELSAPMWVKSGINSKKKVEDKKAMEKRTDQPSPNMADAFHMITAPVERVPRGFFDVFLDN